MSAASTSADGASTDRPAEPGIDLFLGEPTRDLGHWAWLWTGDHEFPVRSHRGLIGRFLVFCKRLLRPVVKSPVNDLWDRQRVFNLILIETLDRERRGSQELREHVGRMQRDFQAAIEAHAGRLEDFDVRIASGMTEVMGHNDALFARVDQKLDRYRREARELWDRLGALIAATEASPPKPLAEVQREQSYLELERRQRGSEEEIAERIAAYLPHLEGRGEVVDLGCGRGEALELFAAHGIAARGVDSSGEMVARCRDKGLAAAKADLLDYLAEIEEGSLGGLVSFHVVEHLPPEALERLIRLAWRALGKGGALILETPSPLSVVMAARNFWIDPTHRRPVHPASLEVLFREAGFEPVQRFDLHPFPADERLPEIDLATLPEDQRALADSVNRLRDLLDDLLFGHRDFAMVGVKP
ncbi:MAG: class I SAM-dependent methyltransferase [bacterium]|nr:class I SAM-dependent methyltransferase [bacterium]